MATAYIALGANLGDRAANIHAAIDHLRNSGVEVVNVSSLREYAAVGGPNDSPPFLNAAAEVRTDLSPRELLKRLLEMEKHLGRQRREKWGPRVIDLDLLLYDDLVASDETLTIPHPLLHERRFVLEPVAEIAPDVIHPVRKLSIAAMLEALPPGLVRGAGRRYDHPPRNLPGD